MPISTRHPNYNHWSEDWQNCRDAYDGQRAIKKAGVRYLPMLKSQGTAAYDAYKNRALFYSITSKTVGALLGLAQGKPPILKYPASMASHFEEQSGTKFYELLCHLVGENLLMGRVGALIDRPMNGGKPTISIYTTESIINWELDDEGTLIFLVLEEKFYDDDPNDPYERVSKIRYREFEIIDGRLKITIHTMKNDKVVESTVESTIVNQGVVMTKIPFFSINPFGLSIVPHKPPMLDIVDINISHYQTSADLENGRHFTGLPTPWITGAEADKPMHIGSESAWVIPSKDARVGYLEFTGQGLQSLEKALAEKQSQLASLSSRLVDNSTRGSEAAETVRLRYTSETASLTSIVRAVEALMNAAYSCYAEMENEDPSSVSIQLNKAFLDERISASLLKAWTEAYLAGAVSKEMLINALQRGDALPPPGQPQGTIPDPPLQPQPTNTSQTFSQE